MIKIMVRKHSADKDHVDLSVFDSKEEEIYITTLHVDAFSDLFCVDVKEVIKGDIEGVVTVTVIEED